MKQSFSGLYGIVSRNARRALLPIDSRGLSQISGILNNSNVSINRQLPSTLPTRKLFTESISNPTNLHKIVSKTNFIKTALLSTSPSPLNYIAISNILQNAELTLALMDPEFGKSVNKYFRKHVGLRLQTTELGGESVLTAKHPSVDHDNSVHFMYFQGTQDKHMHLGPRILTAFASKEWAFYLGEKLEALPKEGDLNVLKIMIPPGVVVISLKEKTIHGFESPSLSVISAHYTDAQEAREMGLSNKDLENKEMINTLTIVPDQTRIKVIKSISYQDIDYIKRQASEEKVRTYPNK